MKPYYADDSVTLYAGDCLDVLRSLPDASVDAVVTDPPYGLEFMGKDWDAPWKAGKGTGEHNAGFSPGAPAVAGVRGEIKSLPSYTGSTNPTCRNCGGTRNGKDRATRRACRCGKPEFPNTTLPRMVAFQQWCELWTAECLRVLKPGGHLLAFGGTRTWHRLACAVEDAGFEIRDSLAWLYGSGFPKSLRVSRDERYCHCGATVHTSSGTSPELSPDDHTRTEDAEGAMEDAAQSAIRGTSGPLDSPVDCRPALGSGDALPHQAGAPDPASSLPQGCAPARSHSVGLVNGRGDESSRTPFLAPRTGHPSSQDSGHPSHSLSGEPTHRQASTSPADTSESAGRTLGNPLGSSSSYGTGFPVCTRCDKPNVDGLGTAMKPAHEPVVVARKPLIGTIAQNVLAHGTGALNIDGCRIGDGGQLKWASPRDMGYHGGSDAGSVEAMSNPAGRWPANVVLDESQAEALDQMSGERPPGKPQNRYTGGDKFAGTPYGDGLELRTGWNTSPGYDDLGGASRFFYVARECEWCNAINAERTLACTYPPGHDGLHEWEEPGAREDDECTRNADAVDMGWTSTRTAGKADVAAPTATATSPLPIDALGSRFTYVAKADASERVRVDGIAHPTVKPLALMRWLVRLVTPPGGTVLEPFAGSGTTVEACILEGFKCIAIEREADYLPLIVQRINRRRDPVAAVKATGDDGGLFDLLDEVAT